MVVLFWYINSITFSYYSLNRSKIAITRQKRVTADWKIMTYFFETLCGSQCQQKPHHCMVAVLARTSIRKYAALLFLVIVCLQYNPEEKYRPHWALYKPVPRDRCKNGQYYLSNYGFETHKPITGGNRKFPVLECWARANFAYSQMLLHKRLPFLHKVLLRLGFAYKIF